MSKKYSSLTQEELNLIEETDRFMEEVNSDPKVANADLPPELYGRLMDKVHAKETERIEKAETEELVRLGRIYKKRRKTRRYWVLAAAAVFALAFGITSIGGGERILEVLHLDGLGRDQSQTNTDGAVKPLENISEEEVYQWIEDEYGVYPVVMTYRPEGVNFIEASNVEDINAILINYGTDEEINIICNLYPNYREHSYGVDAEEAIKEEFSIERKGCPISVKRYKKDDDVEQRWNIDFVYKNVRYSYRIMGEEKEEVLKIINSLFF